MAIPESQLKTWSHLGAIAPAKNTYESIRTALSADRRLQDKDFEVYLQGSYRNSTNIRGDSDVDVIVQLNNILMKDISRLSPQEQQRVASLFTTVTYTWQNFHTDVLAALQKYYDADTVVVGSKSLKLKPAHGRLAADIVPALQYRQYQPDTGGTAESYVEGICFYTTDNRGDNVGRQIINYPKQHFTNGVKKNSENRTNGCYKPIVRLFKNTRSHLVDQGLINSELAPSYFLQCLLYNLPDTHFGQNYQATLFSILNWLESASLDTFTCQNEQLPLFGNTPEQWEVKKARAFIREFIRLWNGW